MDRICTKIHSRNYSKVYLVNTKYPTFYKIFLLIKENGFNVYIYFKNLLYVNILVVISRQQMRSILLQIHTQYGFSIISTVYCSGKRILWVRASLGIIDEPVGNT